ncbi:UPF0739 protein C1orf74 homolog [Pleurodeles waltl]|uniref:UPF0739 protein C1orf74 homolog n=1 Tax=Pleurodeles waltl TaxID=8319 RepID=UPI00370977BB
MSEAFSPLLIAAAQRHLGTGKKKIFPPSTSLNLAAEILAVDCGLKPAFLYDYNTAGIVPLCNFLQELQLMGWIKHHVHLLDIADNFIVVNVENAVLNLESALHRNGVAFVDVSTGQTSPTVCEPCHSEEIKGHIFELLSHLTLFKNGKPGSVSVGAINCQEWNLCTIFGLLLGYPASYWFDTVKGFENCLALTPLRVFSTDVSCLKISNSMQFQVYSFSVPEELHHYLREYLNSWNENLKLAFSKQNCFADLSVNSRLAVLTAVAL